MSRSGKSQKFVNVRREQVLLDDNGLPLKPATSYNPLRPEASGILAESGAELSDVVKASSGKIINPYVPMFIAKAPWYSNIDHVVGARKDEKTDTMDQWYQRGATVQKATKYRKGACENCGAMTHKTKDCLERPRKKGAKYTGKNIAADEVVQHVDLGFEAKRDRWNGYDASEQLEAVKEWELVEEKRKEMRIKQGLDTKERDEFEDEDSDSEQEDGDKNGASKSEKIAVHNLRIREDTAKYLRNLDVDSAFYDPKTRSMRENPYPGKDPKELLYAGDTFERYDSKVKLVNKLKDFAWEKNLTNAPPEATTMSLQANPTQAELLYKSYEKSGGKPQSKEKINLMSKYGGQEHLESLPKELVIGQSEEYVEYNASGQIVKGQERQVVKSKWPEDVYVMNHTHVWGSFWEDGEWGFACCHSTIKGSYCGGIQAIEAKLNTRLKLEAAMAKAERAGRDREDREAMPPPPPQPSKTLLESHEEKLNLSKGKGKATLALERIKLAEEAEKKKLQQELIDIKEREKKEKKQREKEALERARKDKKRVEDGIKSIRYSASSTGANNVPIGKSGDGEFVDSMTPFLPADAKVAEALKAIEASKVQAQGAQGFSYLRKKRKWEMTEEELEAYRIVQHHGDDPMAPFIKDD